MATKRDFVIAYGLQADKSTGSSDTLFVDYINDRVGIGTLSPTQKLHVEGNLHVTGNLTVNGTSPGGGSLTIQDEGASQGTATTLNFTGSAVTASVASGVATINVSGGGGSSISLGNTSISIADTGSDGTITFTTEGTTAMTLSNSQRLGIGTTNPTQKLTVYDNFSVTRGGTAGYSGTAVQFGTGTANPSRIVLPTNSGLNLSIGDFTVEFWLKTNGSQSQFATIIDRSSDNTGSYIGLGQNNGGTSGKISFRPGTTGNSLNSATTVTDGVWRHIACVKYGNNAYIFINGVLDASSTGWAASTNSFSDGRIGGSRFSNGTNTDNGIWASLADFRISNTARYTSNFNTPSALTNDGSTVLLLDLNTTTPTDSSSNAFTLSTSGVALSTEVVVFKLSVPAETSIIVDGVGSVGINTAIPQFKGDVNGDFRIQSANKLRFGGTSTTTNFYVQYNSATNSLDFIAG